MEPSVYWPDALPGANAEFIADIFFLRPDRETFVTAQDSTLSLLNCEVSVFLSRPF